MHGCVPFGGYGAEFGKTPLLSAADAADFGYSYTSMQPWPLIPLCTILHGCIRPLTLAGGLDALAVTLMTVLYGLSYLADIITNSSLPRRVVRYSISAIPPSGFAPLLLIRTCILR